MWCSEYLVRNFRNLRPIRIPWDPGLNLITGKNGSGKTNCLEGLHVLTGWGPFGEIKDLPSWGAESGRAFVSGVFCGEEDVFVSAAVGGATLLKCDGKRTPFAEVRSRIPALAFLSGDMALLDGPPSIRRNFLDRLCALVFPLYARRMNEYGRALRHKSILLREGRSTAALSKAMAPLAASLWTSREEAVRLLSLGLGHFKNLLPASVDLSHERGGASGEGDAAEDWWKSLRASEERERSSCISLVGPHRDDMIVRAGGRPPGAALSRGQMRRASVALMLAAGKGVEARLRRKPLILLDEIASELDRDGRCRMTESLEGTGWQVIAAAAEFSPEEWPGKIWKADDGAIMPL